MLSALVSLGADLGKIEREIGAFFPEPIHFHLSPSSQSGISGFRIRVGVGDSPHDESIWMERGGAHSNHSPDSHHSASHSHCHRTFVQIRDLISASPLSEVTRSRAIAVFRAIAEAEGKIHGKEPEEVHFHEVGAWDSVADIVGVCLALEQLGVEGISCGPLPAGIGTLHCAHGEMPNPAPATQALLRGMAITQTDEPHELVTPTGAALLSVLSRSAPVPPVLVVEKEGIGFGSRELESRPNLLRATLLSSPEKPTSAETVWMVETNLDDAPPEWIAATAQRLMEAGALDVWTTPILMKKGRAGCTLSVLAEEQSVASLRLMVFRELPTFGIRFYPVKRETLSRRFDPVETPWGVLPVKVGTLQDGSPVTASPEFTDCDRVAREKGLPLRQVYEEVMGLWREGH